MMFKTLSISAATVAFLATGALAQATPPAAPAMPPAAASKPDTGTATSTTTTTQTQTNSVNFKSAMARDEMLASKLTGMEVRNAAGEDLGDINDLVLDKSGKASAVIIGVGGFLGLGEKDVAVPYEVLTFADASDGKNVVRLDATKDALKSAPNYVYKDATTTSSTSPSDRPLPKTQ